MFVIILQKVNTDIAVQISLLNHKSKGEVKMKKTFCIIFVMAVILSFAGCAPTTYTEKGEDYVYSVGETINILDKESKQVLGSVTISDAVVIKDEPFIIEEFAKYDENSNPIYEKVSYEAVVQINYKYTIADSTKTITTSNFSVFDKVGNSAEFSPKTNYEKIPTKDNSFVVAVKEKGEFVDLSFRYHISQTAIAKIKAYYEDNANISEQPVDEQSEDTVEQDKTALNVMDDSNNESKSNIQIWIFIVVFIVQALSNIALIVVLIVFFKKYRKTMPKQ